MITDEQAKAVAEISKLGQQLVGAGSGFIGWLGNIIGNLPQDVIGVAGGDWLAAKRRRNLLAVGIESQVLLNGPPAERRTEPSPRLLLPLLECARDEATPELQRLWAALLANTALDGGRKVRSEFFQTLRQLEPADAVYLDMVAHPERWKTFGTVVSGTIHAQEEMFAFERFEKTIGLNQLELSLAKRSLTRLDLIMHPNGVTGTQLTLYGKGLFEALTVA